MKLANGCYTVNCGDVIQICEQDIFNKSVPLQVEILEPKKHDPDYITMCYYYLENTNKGIVKTEVTIYKDLRYGREGSEIYRFKSANSLQHYWSRHYASFIGMPSKYYDIVKFLHSAFMAICNGRIRYYEVVQNK